MHRNAAASNASRSELMEESETGTHLVLKLGASPFFSRCLAIR